MRPDYNTLENTHQRSLERKLKINVRQHRFSKLKKKLEYPKPERPILRK